MADFWGPERRGVAMAIFALMPFAGPSLAPLISGFMSVTRTGTDWRWIFCCSLSFPASACSSSPLFYRKPMCRISFTKKSKRLREETGDNRWHAALEEGSESFRAVLNRTIFKPSVCSFKSPCSPSFLSIFRLRLPSLLSLDSTQLTLSNLSKVSFIYGMIYLLFEALPIIFGEQHGLNAGLSGLPFLSLVTGAGLGVIIYIFYFNKNYVALHRQIAPRPRAARSASTPFSSLLLAWK